MSAARDWMRSSIGSCAGIVRRPLAAALICVVALATPTTHAIADFAKGTAFYAKKDYEHALPELLPAAQDGEVVAQFILGVMYDVGQYVAVDKQAAAGWYKQAADQGHP